MKAKCLLILFFIFLASVSFADEYVLVKGEGIDVCEAYKKNLNSYSMKVLPMAHWMIRKLDPEMKDFSSPKWERILDGGIRKFSNAGDILIRISNFIWERDVNPVEHITVSDVPKWRSTKEQKAAAYKHYYYLRHEMGRVMRGHLIAEIDIDNDGKPEPVYLDRLYETSNGGPLIILKNDYTDIDYEKTKLVMVHPSRKEAGWKDLRDCTEREQKEGYPLCKYGKIATGDASSLSYGVFLYKGKTYFDLWGGSDPNDSGGKTYYPFANHLHVFIVDKNNTSEICRYKYVRTIYK